MFSALYVAKSVVFLNRRRSETLRFLVSGDVVRLEDNFESRHPGRLSLISSDKKTHLILEDGFVINKDAPLPIARRIQRVVKQREFNSKRPNSGRAVISGWLGEKPKDFGIDAAELNLTRDGLRLPAWLQPAELDSVSCDTWVIHVHGRTANRGEALRTFDFFHHVGFTNLAISIRNNTEADRFSGNNTHLGQIEWVDLEAGVAHAIEAGAKNILLFAISQGTVVSAEFLRHSSLASRISGVIADSPVVDWPAAILEQTKQAGVSDRTAKLGMQILESSIGSKIVGLSEPLRLKELGFSNWCHQFDLPILLMHSHQDGYIPIDPVEKVAREHPDFVQIIEYENAGHVKLFNLDPARYKRNLQSFIDRLKLTTE